LGLLLLSSNHNTTKYYVNRRKTTTITQSKHDHILCSLTDENDNPCRCCRPSVNTICGRIMIGLSFSSVSKHNMWSFHVCLLTDDNNDNPTIIRPHIMFTDGIQRQPNHNTTIYCRCCLPSVNTIFGGIMIGLSLLSSVSKHNMWSYYDWVVVVMMRPHCMFTDRRQQRQPNHNRTTYCVY
jgi:hypothetical protein